MFYNTHNTLHFIMPSFTPDSELDLLFSPDLISSEVKSALHEDLHVRQFLPPSIFDYSDNGP